MKKNFYIKFHLFLLIFFAINFCVFSFTHAQNARDTATEIQVSPTRFDYDLNAGEKVSGVINVKNYASQEYEIEIQLEDFYVSEDSSRANFFVPDQSHPLIAYDMINWVKPENINFTVAGGEAKNLNFEIEVPEDTPTGGYYGAIFVQYKQKNAAPKVTGSGVIIKTRVGVLLVLAVKGRESIVRSGEIKNFSASQKIFWDSPAELSADVFNSGNLHYKLVGNIDIYKFGKKTGSIEIEPKVVYPQKSRKYEEKWPFSYWAYGFYRAKANFVSEDGAISLFKDTTFWVIPWKTTIAIIIIIAMIFFAWKLFRSKFEIKRKDQDKNESYKIL